MEDQNYMKLALELAKKGLGWTSPNPMVGALLVKDGRIIGQGYHARYGELHAERSALAACTEDPEGSTLYVTLEPCCHQGRQPPCTDAILEAKIARVVVGSGDPNPLVAGKGIQILQGHGISVTEHVLEKECQALNEVFFHYIRTKRPYVVMKYAMTMDGKIAAYTGASKWITGEAARAHVQTLRHRYRGIMAGIGTVLTDDPLLTCRMEGGRDPVRIICDTDLRIPLSSQIIRTAGTVPTIIATCCGDDRTLTGSGASAGPKSPAGTGGPAGILRTEGTAKTIGSARTERTAGAEGAAGERAGRTKREAGGTAPQKAADPPACLEKIEACRRAGCQVLSLPEQDGHVDLSALMDRLGATGIDSILLEGGMTLNWSALRSGIVDKVFTYIAPKLLGGLTAKSPVGGPGFPHPDAGICLKNSKISTFGGDILIESEVCHDICRDEIQVRHDICRDKGQVGTDARQDGSEVCNDVYRDH